MDNPIIQSIRDRLYSIAKTNNEDFQIVLIRFTLERLLYRLSLTKYNEQFILKGAFLYYLWGGPNYRPTRDIDFLSIGSNDVFYLEDIFKRIITQTTNEKDGLLFLSDSVKGQKILKSQEYEGVRIKLLAKLGSIKIPIQVDIGFNDATVPEPEIIEFTTLLEFPSLQLRSYQKETVIAEKFQYMIKGGIANSRMKDFFDIWYLESNYEYHGEKLKDAIKATFNRRRTKIPNQIPIAFSKDFYSHSLKQRQWKAFISKNELSTNDMGLKQITIKIRDFIMPPTLAAENDQPFHKSWKYSEGWVSNDQAT